MVFKTAKYFQTIFSSNFEKKLPNQGLKMFEDLQQFPKPNCHLPAKKNQIVIFNFWQKG